MFNFGKPESDEEAAIRRRVRIERSEHKRRDEIERLMFWAIPLGVIIVIGLVAKLSGHP